MDLSVRVENMMARLEREDVNMHGLILTAGGEEKARAYYAPFREGLPHRMYSVSKTMTGIAVGMLIEDGKLNLDDCIVNYFPDWTPGDADERLRNLAIRDMLRMATCYRWTTYREGVDENWAKTFFTGTPTHEPGTVFYYDTGCSQALAALVHRVSGKNVLSFLEKRLLEPLGCEDDRFWLRDPSGECQGGTGLCMSLRDLHRVAVCLLNGGEGLVPEWYVREMGRKQIDTVLQANEEEQYGYGWQCWMTRAGWAMYGLGGQLAIICPEKNAVMSTIADTRLDPCGVQRIYDAFFEEVYPYLGTEDMAPKVYERETRGVPDAQSAPDLETGEFVFPEGNQLGLKTMKVEKACLVYENARGRAELPFERGRTLRTDYPGWPEVPALVSAGMAAENQLRIRCFAVGKAPCGFDMLLSRKGKILTVQSRKSHDPVTEGYEGVASGTLI